VLSSALPSFRPQFLCTFVLSMQCFSDILSYPVFITYLVVPLVHLSCVHQLDLSLHLLLRQHPFFDWSIVCLIPFPFSVALFFVGYILKIDVANSIACTLIYMMSYPEDWFIQFACI
jgi:hypothetical protein